MNIWVSVTTRYWDGQGRTGDVLPGYMEGSRVVRGDGSRSIVIFCYMLNVIFYVRRRGAGTAQ